MTTQPFKSAAAIACNCNTLLPLPFSPKMTWRTVLFLSPASSNCRTTSSVSFLTSVAGRLKRLQPCVGLKAAAALRASRTSFDSPSIFPALCESTMFFAVMSSNPCTSNALVLLKTILLRIALRSPC